jgi:uncharacterized protein HemX
MRRCKGTETSRSSERIERQDEHQFVPVSNSGEYGVVGLIVILVLIVGGSYYLQGKQIDSQSQRQPAQTQQLQ